jgi:predicted phosphoadenosine phosphosulfate sulfurtransferase
VNDLVDELRVKMTDYRGKYMEMQLEHSKVAPEEYREAMEALKAQNSFPTRTVPVEELWARVAAQERQCTTLLDDNYQLRLRLEQVRVCA